MNTAKAVKEIRKKSKMNQRVFAAEIGISQTALAQIETGKTLASDKTLESIAKNFNTTIDVIKMAGLEVEKDLPADKQDLFNELFPDFAEKIAAMIVIDK